MSTLPSTAYSFPFIQSSSPLPLFIFHYHLSLSPPPRHTPPLWQCSGCDAWQCLALSCGPRGTRAQEAHGVFKRVSVFSLQGHTYTHTRAQCSPPCPQRESGQVDRFSDSHSLFNPQSSGRWWRTKMLHQLTWQHTSPSVCVFVFL